MSREPDLLKSTILGHLAALGWVGLSGPGPGLAEKTYQTEVGPKEALAYAYVSEGALRLKAEYYSEGRNALSTIRVAVGLDDDDDAAIQAKAVRFAAEVDHAVSQTYAYRLLHDHKDEDDQPSIPFGL